ncbi:MAG: hypothetical protein ACR2KB_12920 [Chitinophagaceae bacterium]
MAFKPSNLPLSTIRKILSHSGCKKLDIKGGHEKWTRSDLLRPIIIQTHIDPVPTFIILQIMRTLNLSRNDMERILREI